MTDADILIRRSGAVGHVTLNRPSALNALTYAMCLALERALLDWRADPAVCMVLIDASGERAFCAGGDIAEMYATGTAGDYAYGQQFWRDEYRLNALLSEYPKPVVSFLQGFTMGGGVGVGCHGSHRIVGETSRIAMPECGIGLVPDVGGSLLLARAPGALGEYLGTTASRMDPWDAIHAGFADHFVPQADWPALSRTLLESGDAAHVLRAAHAPRPAPLRANQPLIDRCFGAPDLPAIQAALQQDGSEFAHATLAQLQTPSPLAMTCALEIIRAARAAGSIRTALDLEYRFTARSMAQGEFLEGIRAAIIDRDKTPRWLHASPAAVTPAERDAMLAPLDTPLIWEDAQ